MYFIMTIRFIVDGELLSISDYRGVGYFRKWEEAHKKVMDNAGDIFEDGYYNYAVILKIGQGLYPNQREESWYAYDNMTRGVYTDNRPVHMPNGLPVIVG